MLVRITHHTEYTDRRPLTLRWTEEGPTRDAALVAALTDCGSGPPWPETFPGELRERGAWLRGLARDVPW